MLWKKILFMCINI